MENERLKNLQVYIYDGSTKHPFQSLDKMKDLHVLLVIISESVSPHKNIFCLLMTTKLQLLKEERKKMF
jgi:hypothetical protein